MPSIRLKRMRGRAVKDFRVLRASVKCGTVCAAICLFSQGVDDARPPEEVLRRSFEFWFAGLAVVFLGRPVERAAGRRRYPGEIGLRYLSQRNAAGHPALS